MNKFKYGMTFTCESLCEKFLSDYLATFVHIYYNIYLLRKNVVNSSFLSMCVILKLLNIQIKKKV